MRLLKLSARNFRSFRDLTKIDLSNGSDSSEKNIVLIGGMNGAGKTTLLEALKICLYGEKKERILRSINRLEAMKGNYSCQLEVDIEVENGDRLTVQRTWGISRDLRGKREPRPSDLEEEVWIFKNGLKLAGVTNQMWQEYLSSALPEGITQFFFFDGEKIQEMASDDDAEIKLKKSIESALGIDMVRTLLEDLRKLHGDEKRLQNDVTSEDLEALEINSRNLAKKIESAEARRTELTEQISEFDEEKNHARSKFLAHFGGDSESARDRKTRQQEIGKVKGQFEEVTKKIGAILNDELPSAVLSKLFPSFRDQINAETKQSQEASLQRLRDSLLASLSAGIDAPETVCCHRSLDEDERSQLRERIVEILDCLFPRSETVETILDLSETSRSQILARMKVLETGFIADFRRMASDKEILVQHLNSLEDGPLSDVPEEHQRVLHEQMQIEIEGYAKQIGRKTEERDQVDSELQSLRFQKEELESQQKEMYRNYQYSLEQRAMLDTCKRVIDLLDEYVDQLRDVKIKELQEKTLYMYKQLASKGDLVSDLKIDPQSFLITVTDTNGQKIAKRMLSAGEKEVFAISLLWGLAQTSHLDLPVIIDTPLARLDSIHRDRIVANYFPRAGSQVIILSTDTEVDKSYFGELDEYIRDSFRLVFDKSEQRTTISPGYFWR